MLKYSRVCCIWMTVSVKVFPCVLYLDDCAVLKCSHVCCIWMTVSVNVFPCVLYLDDCKC